MKALLTCNLSDSTVKAGNAAWQPPVLTYRETLTLALRLTRTAAGEEIEPALTVNWLQCSLGFVDARPLRGEWALQIGGGAQTAGNTTAALSYTATPAEVQAAINAKTAVTALYGAASVKQRAGSWWIVFATATAAVPLTVRDNTLFPLSFGQINAVEIDGVWHHEVRLIQLPADSTSTSERILPPAPTVTRVQAGATVNDYGWNEIQRLYVRPDFRATYYLQFGGARTAHLSKDDGPEEILAALVAVLGANFATTLAADFTIDVEFTGEGYAGEAQELIEVVPVAPPPGDLTFSLPLNRAALLAWLRVAEEVTLPLEVMIGVTENAVATTAVPIRTNLTIRRPLNWAELEENPNVDWLRPASPRDYIPRSTNTVFTGDKSAAYVVGDGVADEFAIAHAFATVDVHVFAHENVTNGRQLTEGTDYSVVINSASEVTVTALGDVPEEDAWTVYVRAMEPIASFAEDLEITIGQVTGLEDRLAAIEAAVDDLEALVPSTPLGTSSAAGGSLAITIPALSLVFPGAGTGTSAPSPLGGLLPAIHDATATSLDALPLGDAADHAGEVWQNNTGAEIVVPGGLRTRSSRLADEGFFGSDGRRWLPLTRRGATKSYFPRDFEVELFCFQTNTGMLRAGSTLRFEAALKLQLLKATTRAQYILVVEHGTVPSQTEPATTATNLWDIAWNATPLLSQRVILSGVQIAHTFGVEIIRSGLGVLSANKMLYGLKTAAGSVPESADMALRARLIDFDTENSVAKARGAVFIDLPSTAATIQY